MLFFFIVLIEEAYEKQVQELEDENEKCQGELSNISKQLEKLKQENSELNKTKVNSNKSSKIKMFTLF